MDDDDDDKENEKEREAARCNVCKEFNVKIITVVQRFN